MKKMILLFGTTLSINGHASGFTWFSPVSEMLHVPEYTLTFIFVGLIILVSGHLYKLRVSKLQSVVIPDDHFSLRNVYESLGQFMYDQTKGIVGDKAADRFFPYSTGLFITLLLSNLIGLVPGFLPPTSFMNTTLSIGIASFIFYNVIGIKHNGVINYLKHFAGPVAFMAFLIFPLEIISNAVRPFTLALRLRGNMYGDHELLATMTNLVPVVVPVVFYILGILVCVIQALVFTLLSLVYVALVIEDHDHDHQEAH